MTAVICILLFSILNRFAGGGLIWRHVGNQHGGVLEGRAIWYATPAAFAALVPLLGWADAALCAGSFLLWRTPGWYNSIDAGTNTETAARDFVVMSARGLLLFPVFVYGAFRDWSVLPLVLLLATALSVGLAYHAAWHFKPLQRFACDGVARAEFMAGALIGVAFAALSE